jgi:hypothetical protein
MMIELVVVRHGETFANKDHIIQVLAPFFYFSNINIPRQWVVDQELLARSGSGKIVRELNGSGSKFEFEIKLL